MTSQSSVDSEDGSQVTAAYIYTEAAWVFAIWSLRLELYGTSPTEIRVEDDIRLSHSVCKLPQVVVGGDLIIAWEVNVTCGEPIRLCFLTLIRTVI